MSTWDLLADLEVQIDGYTIDHHSREVKPGWQRSTTTYVLHGEGAEGRGEDITKWPPVARTVIDRGLLLDPLAPPSEIDELAAGRETAIVLTCPWHARDAQSLAERLGAPLYVPPPDEGDPNPVKGQVFRAGDRLPVGAEAFPGMEPNDLVLWVESRRALVAGDTLIDRGNGLEFPVDWANKGVPSEEILEGLRPLLELPVEHVLPTHGAPTDRAALERALS